MAITTDLPEEHFDPEEFNALLEAHGVEALWRRARDCPCTDPTTGQASIVCPFCRDFPGVIWDDGAELRIFAPSRQRRDEYQDVGQLMQGIVTLTFPSSILVDDVATDVTPGHLDRVELLSAVMVVRAKFTRGAVDPADRSVERLRLRPVLGVEFCDAIVADALVPFVYGDDFTINADGDIIWGVGLGPAADVQYSIRYRTRPSYVIWSPMSRDEGGTKQPYRCLAQRLDFFQQPAVGEGD